MESRKLFDIEGGSKNIDKNSTTTNPKQPTDDQQQETIDDQKQEDALDEENDKSASGVQDRMQKRADASKLMRSLAFTTIIMVLVGTLPLLEITWQLNVSSLNFITIQDNSTRVIDIQLKTCELHVQYTDAPATAMQVHASLMKFPFLSNTLTIDNQEHKIVAELGVGRSLARYVPCQVTISMPPLFPLHNINLRVQSFGSLPSSISFHDRSNTSSSALASMFGSLEVSGPLVYLGSSITRQSPASMIDVQIGGGIVNITSLNDASRVNITTASADVYLMSSSNIISIDSLLQASHFYVLVGACIERIGCYKSKGSTMNDNQGSNSATNKTLSYGNNTGLQAVTLYPSYDAHASSSSTSAPAIVSASLSSLTGSMYVGAINQFDLHARSFVLTSGKIEPEFDKTSTAALSRVKQFIDTAPDEDSLIILNIEGPNVQQKKWLYATRGANRTRRVLSVLVLLVITTQLEVLLTLLSLLTAAATVATAAEPYIQIEPSFMFAMSMGILSARLQQLYVRIAVGNWPFIDSRRGNTAGGNTTQLPSIINVDQNDDDSVVIHGTTYEMYLRLQQAMKVPLLVRATAKDRSKTSCV